eukprot:256072_1
MAAQVIGGICSLIAEPRSILPYIGELLSGIRSILIDPIPEVRCASALAIRSLSESIDHEECSQIEDCFSWLMTLLNDVTTNNVQRFGAAQGLSELLASYHSDDKIRQTLGIIFEGFESKSAVVRESFAQVFVYLPKALGSEDFPFWMERVIPPLLQLLGDEAEPVRSVCLKGLKIIVFMFHSTEYDLLLELLEEGLEYYDYRVRDATLILIGDLLNGLAGGEGSVSYETNATSATEVRILDALGQQRRNEVFSLLYMARSDPEQPVRSRANITWKGLVYNSSRMLKSILDTLMHALITALSSENRERQEAASKSLGDLVGNAGQFIIPKIMPILSRGIRSSANAEAYKEGIALGLAQVLSNAHPRLICDYENEVISSIAAGICDKLARVRSGCGEAFNIAVEVFGRQCVNQIIPNLCDDLRDQTHIDGVKEVLRASNAATQQVILSYLIDHFELQPFSLLSAHIAKHCQIARSIVVIVESIISRVAEDESLQSCANQAIVDICRTPQCMEQVLKTLCSRLTTTTTLSLLSAFVCQNKTSEYYELLISSVLPLFNEEDDDSLRTAAWNTLNDIQSSMCDEDLAHHIDCFRHCLLQISTAPSKRSKILGFCCGAGLKPVMRMFDYGIRNGSFEERASAAKLMMDLIRLSNLDSVKPFLNKIAGALIRICADRFPSNVKCAILQTLSLLIRNYGKLMRGFYTPLQTTFVKVIHDPSRDVRCDASTAICELMAFSPKFDNLLRDLNNLLKKNDSVDGAITKSVLSTMSHVLSKVGPKVKPAILADIDGTFNSTDVFRSERDDSLRFAASKCIASMVHCLSNREERTQMICNLLDIDAGDDDWRSIEYDLNSLAFLIRNRTVYDAHIHEQFAQDIEETVLNQAFLESPHVLLQISACRNGYYFVGRCATLQQPIAMICNILENKLLPLLSSKINNNKEDIVISCVTFLLDAMHFGRDDAVDDEEEEEELFTGTYDIANRWSTPSFVALFPLLRSCLMDIVDIKKKKLRFKVNKALPNWILSVIIHHCHSSLNIGDGLVKFPCFAVSLLLLKCIDCYPLYCNAVSYGLCNLSGSMREYEQKEEQKEKEDEEDSPAKDENKYDLMKKQLAQSPLRAMLHRDGCLSKNVKCRKAALLALCDNECVLYPQSDLVKSRIWILSHDVNEADGTFIRTRAKKLWKDGEFSFDDALLDQIICCLGTPSMEVRRSMALSLGAFCGSAQSKELKNIRHVAVVELIASYKSHKDEFVASKKKQKKKTKISKWTFRDGVSLSLASISRIPDLSKHYVMMIFDFLLRYGLHDPDHNVYKENLECGRCLFGAHGSLYATEFLDKLENALDNVSQK